MRPAMALAVLAPLIAVLPGCSDTTTTSESGGARTEAAPCQPGRGSPITEATLKRALRARGIRLYRVDECAIFGDPNDQTPLAMLGNLWDDSSPDDYDRIVTAHGFIVCDIYKRSLGPKRLERVKYEGDEETHLRTRNVTCTIYPDTNEQIDALADALAELPATQR